MLACIGISPSYPTARDARRRQSGRRSGHSLTARSTPKSIWTPTTRPTRSTAAISANRNCMTSCKAIAQEEGWDWVLDGDQRQRSGRLSARHATPHASTTCAHRWSRPASPSPMCAPSPATWACRSGTSRPWPVSPRACPTARPSRRRCCARSRRPRMCWWTLGFDQFRVRHHDKIARIEVPVQDFPAMLKHHDADRRRHQGRRLSIRHPGSGRLPQRLAERRRTSTSSRCRVLSELVDRHEHDALGESPRPRSPFWMLPSGISGDMFLGCLVDAGWPCRRRWSSRCRRCICPATTGASAPSEVMRGPLARRWSTSTREESQSIAI